MENKDLKRGFISDNIQKINSTSAYSSSFTQKIIDQFGSLEGMYKFLSKNLEARILKQKTLEGLRIEINLLEDLSRASIIVLANKLNLYWLDLKRYITEVISKKALRELNQEVFVDNTETMFLECLSSRDSKFLKGHFKNNFSKVLESITHNGFSRIEYGKYEQCDELQESQNLAAIHFFIARMSLLGFKTTIIKDQSCLYNLLLEKNSLVKRVFISSDIRQLRKLLATNLKEEALRVKLSREVDYLVQLDICDSLFHLIPLSDIDIFSNEDFIVSNFFDSKFSEYLERLDILDKDFYK